MNGSEPLLLLYSERSEPVTAAIFDRRDRLGRELVAISAEELLDEVAVGPQWTFRSHTIDPARTALVNRLTSLDVFAPETPGAAVLQTELWRWLARELPRFAYASALPTVHSAFGALGSLVDQWIDLPPLLGGLRVPAHRTAWHREALQGDVYRVNPWHLYSLGRSAAGSAAPGSPEEIEYVRPPGHLVHATQVGGIYTIANAPPTMTARQAQYIGGFVGAIASASSTRILEHAFFVGTELPVFYASFPVPVLTGGMGVYPELVVQGLNDDISRRIRRAH